LQVDSDEDGPDALTDGLNGADAGHYWEKDPKKQRGTRAERNRKKTSYAPSEHSEEATDATGQSSQEYYTTTQSDEESEDDREDASSAASSTVSGRKRRDKKGSSDHAVVAGKRRRIDG
jgi:hypothetical protein